MIPEISEDGTHSRPKQSVLHDRPFGIRRWASSLRKRNELAVIARNRAESRAVRTRAGAPFRLGFLDSRARARNQIPPDVSLAVERGSAENHEPRVLNGLDLETPTRRSDG